MNRCKVILFLPKASIDYAKNVFSGLEYFPKRSLLSGGLFCLYESSKT